MSALSLKFPGVAFSTVPVMALTWHSCVELGDDDHVATVSIEYRRYGGAHRINACGLCLPAELAYLHHGHPLPLYVRVVELDDHTGPVAA